MTSREHPPPPAPQHPSVLSRGESCLKLTCWSVAVLVVLIAVGGFALFKHLSWKKKTVFVDEWDSYIELYEKRQRYFAAEKIRPKARAKLLFIDVGARDLSKAHICSLHFDLDERIRAEAPEEVGCVAFMTWNREKVLKYPDGHSGLRSVPEVTLIDLETGIVIAGKQFKGGDPPATKRGKYARMGSHPIAEIHEFLENELSETGL